MRTVTGVMELQDRRVAVGQRHHQAIIDAAIALMEEHGSTGFTVEDVASRAGVARRTVFNHFGSFDDVVAAAASRVLGNVLDGLMAYTSEVLSEGDSTSLGQELVALVANPDVVPPLVYIARVLGDVEPTQPWRAVLTQRTMARVSADLATAMAHRYPKVDRLDVDLMVHAFIAAVTVIYHHWVRDTGAVDTRESRATWALMVDQLASLFPYRP